MPSKPGWAAQITSTACLEIPRLHMYMLDCASLTNYRVPWCETIHSSWMIPLLTGDVRKFCHPPHFHGYLPKAGTSASFLFPKLLTHEMQKKEYAGLWGLLVTPLSLALNSSWLCPSLTSASTSGGQNPPYPDPLFLQSCLKVIGYQHTFYLVRAWQHWHRHITHPLG